MPDLYKEPGMLAFDALICKADSAHASSPVSSTSAPNRVVGRRGADINGAPGIVAAGLLGITSGQQQKLCVSEPNGLLV